MGIINRRAKFNYHIHEIFEAGIVLSGFEVKSVRAGRVDLSNSYVKIQGNEVFLKNAYIYPLSGAINSYDPKSDRKLLLRRSQINGLKGKISGSSLTLIPLSMYSTRNLIKVKIALAGHKKKYDKKRATKIQEELKRLN